MANAIPSDVTDARGRKLDLRVPDAGDQFDIIEIAGNSSSNQMWMYRAIAVYSVSAIDGVPMPRPTSVKELKANARTLGDDGITAIFKVFFPTGTDKPDDGEAAETAKNSAGTP